MPEDRAVGLYGAGLIAQPALDLRQELPGKVVLGRQLQNVRQRLARVLQVTCFQVRTAQRDSRRVIRGVARQPLLADANCVVELSGAAILLGQLQEGPRERIPGHPLLQGFDGGGGLRGGFRHRP
jgi:hypothetical protein